MTDAERKEKIRALIKRMDEQSGGPAKREAAWAQRDHEQAEWERVWPHHMRLPVTEHESDTQKIIWKIRLKRTGSEVPDPRTAEAIDWVVAQGFPHATRGDKIGFLEADHAFAFKMRWG